MSFIREVFFIWGVIYWRFHCKGNKFLHSHHYKLFWTLPHPTQFLFPSTIKLPFTQNQNNNNINNYNLNTQKKLTNISMIDKQTKTLRNSVATKCSLRDLCICKNILLLSIFSNSDHAPIVSGGVVRGNLTLSGDWSNE